LTAGRNDAYRSAGREKHNLASHVSETRVIAACAKNQRGEIRQVADRLEGARRVVTRHPGVSLEVIETRALSVLEGREAGNAILARERSEQPDAVFAANDLIAMGVLQALNMQGALHVPRDIALIGYDDIDFASASVVPLSSIRQPSALIGKTAVEILVEEADDPTLAPRQVVFQPELVVRASTVG
jgi:LacI family transcriptional regulator